MKPIPTKTLLFSFDTVLEKADIRQGQIVADFGCGKSLFFLYALLSLVGKEGRVYGVDVLPEVIETLSREIQYHDLPGIIPVLGNLDAKYGVQIPDTQIDRAFLISTIHQSADIIGMLYESSRLIKKGGLLIIIDWEKADSPIGPHNDRKLDHSSIKEAAEIANLELIDHFKPGSYHYGLVFRKNY
ncbi:MAG: methyltransferase domain-containing protein [Candidatus Falkowbacteria bacterium]|nr:methyltransferase domain-containing protein [Candidatus Falkowbacteria bacterium]